VDGVRDAVGRLDGVQHVDVELGTKLVRIAPARDRTLDLAAIGPAVRAGSARMTRMRIVAEGAVEPGARFRIAGWPDAYAIEGAAPPVGPASIRANVHFATGAPTLHLLGTKQP
jgi:hypothetical protein